MTAIGFVLMVAGFALEKVADEFDAPDWLGIIGSTVFLVGCCWLFSGISQALWRWMP